MEKKRVLIITYYWPPSGGAGVQRWLKFVKYLPQFGWTPVVFTPENPEAPAQDESLLKDIPAEAEIIKLPIWEPYTFYKKFTGRKKSVNVNAGFLNEGKDKGFLEKVSIWIRGNFFIPDARKFWIKPASKYLLQYLKENSVDAIVTTGPPHSMHLIGLKLKEKLGVKWIADFRDPWTNIDFYDQLMLSRWADKKHHRLERKVLETADEVLAVGKVMAEELKELGAKKCSVIYNGFDIDLENQTEVSLDEEFSITHVGSLNKDRDHKIFWQALSELVKENKEFSEKLKIRFVGKVDQCAISNAEKYNLTKYLELIPYVPSSEVFSYLKRSRVLYLPVNNTPNAKGILTGKFFEYLAAQRPVLAIGPEDGEVAEVLKETDAGEICDFGDRDTLKRNIIQLLNTELTFEQNSIKEFSRKHLALSLVDVLKRALQ